MYMELLKTPLISSHEANIRTSVNLAFMKKIEPKALFVRLATVKCNLAVSKAPHAT